MHHIFVSICQFQSSWPEYMYLNPTWNIHLHTSYENINLSWFTHLYTSSHSALTQCTIHQPGRPQSWSAPPHQTAQKHGPVATNGWVKNLSPSCDPEICRSPCWPCSSKLQPRGVSQTSLAPNAGETTKQNNLEWIAWTAKNTKNCSMNWGFGLSLYGMCWNNALNDIGQWRPLPNTVIIFHWPLKIPRRSQALAAKIPMSLETQPPTETNWPSIRNKTTNK